MAPKFFTLPTLDLLGVALDALPSTPADAQLIAKEWFIHFSRLVRAGNIDEIVALFSDISPSWRDYLALSWDFHTKAGKDAIHQFLDTHLVHAKIDDLVLKETAQVQQLYPDLVWVHADFTFTTEHGIGSGILRLIPKTSNDGLEWKAHGVFTNLEGLKRFPEQIGPLRQKRSEHGKWSARREKEFESAEDPQVLIIGGAQSGLTIAARLKYLGVTALVVDKNDRVGDSWRGRYEALSLHDPVWYDHMPYLPFPPTWPVYPAAAKLADWLESYAKTLELNVWTSTEAKRVIRDPKTNKWTVEVQRKNYEPRVFSVNHVILAMGLGGGLPKMPSYPGMGEFRGTIIHSSKYKSAKEFTGKKVVVLGAATSGHDICGDCVRDGVDVTMYQRSPTCILSVESVERAFALYSENGPPADVADRISASIPIPMTMSLAQRFVKTVNEADRELHDGLRSVGFRLSDGPEGTGVPGLIWKRAGGFYFDHGTSRMIVDQQVKLKHGKIQGFSENGIDFADGSHLPADVVICATGINQPKLAFSPILGDEVFSKLSQLWVLDEEGEVSGIWRQSGVSGLWIMMGNLMMARFHSLHIALQIKAIEEGILSVDSKFIPAGSLAKFT